MILNGALWFEDVHIKFPRKNKMYMRCLSKFFNILEVRKAFLEYKFLFPLEFQKFFSELISKKSENEYIDFEEAWKKMR